MLPINANLKEYLLDKVTITNPSDSDVVHPFFGLKTDIEFQDRLETRDFSCYLFKEGAGELAVSNYLIINYNSQDEAEYLGFMLDSNEFNALTGLHKKPVDYTEEVNANDRFLNIASSLKQLAVFKNVTLAHSFDDLIERVTAKFNEQSRSGSQEESMDDDVWDYDLDDDDSEGAKEIDLSHLSLADTDNGADAGQWSTVDTDIGSEIKNNPVHTENNQYINQENNQGSTQENNQVLMGGTSVTDEDKETHPYPAMSHELMYTDTFGPIVDRIQFQYSSYYLHKQQDELGLPRYIATNSRDNIALVEITFPLSVECQPRYAVNYDVLNKNREFIQAFITNPVVNQFMGDTAKAIQHQQRMAMAREMKAQDLGNQSGLSREARYM